MSYTGTQNSEHTSMLEGSRHSFFKWFFFPLTGHRGIALGHSPFSLHPPTTNICCKSATPKPNCLQLTQKAIKKIVSLFQLERETARCVACWSWSFLTSECRKNCSWGRKSASCVNEGEHCKKRKKKFAIFLHERKISLKEFFIKRKI